MIEIIVDVEILFKNITKIQKKPININHFEVTTINYANKRTIPLIFTMWSHFARVSVRCMRKMVATIRFITIRIYHAFHRTEIRTHIACLSINHTVVEKVVSPTNTNGSIQSTSWRATSPIQPSSWRTNENACQWHIHITSPKHVHHAQPLWCRKTSGRERDNETQSECARVSFILLCICHSTFFDALSQKITLHITDRQSSVLMYIHNHRE